MGQSARAGSAGGLLAIPGDASGGSLRSARSVEKPTIVLVDPRPLTRESVVHLLTTGAREFAVQPISSAEELDEDIPTTVGIVIFNIGHGSLSDQWVSREIQTLQARLPESSLVVLSDAEDMNEVVKALRCGVRGYIPTTFSPKVAVEAIRLVHAGGTFIPASALQHVGNGHRSVDALEPGSTGSPAQPEETTKGERDVQAEVFRGLTPRQREVLRLLCEGQPNKNIAYSLNMQEGTVKVHVRQIMKKLKVTNRTQVAFLANRLCAEAGQAR